MAKSSEQKEMVNAAIGYLETRGEKGATTSELVTIIGNQFPGTEFSVVRNLVSKLVELSKRAIRKPKRGFYIHKQFLNGFKEQQTDNKDTGEGRVYQPFADWLKKGVERCSESEVVGGSKVKLKWGNPDVLGIKYKQFSENIRPTMEIITAEIKNTRNGTALIEAFGQACSYKLFSHKTYVVIPQNANENDIDHINNLCSIIGIGLVLFDETPEGQYKFEIIHSPTKSEPNMDYIDSIIGVNVNRLLGQAQRRFRSF